MEKVIYLYHHLPKCGGNSFIRTCALWFPPRREMIGSYPDRERIAEYARTRFNYDDLPENCFVHGHLVSRGIRPFERYGDYIESGKFRVVTIFRDPLERTVSAWFHQQKKGRQWEGTFEDWLCRIRNQFSKYLGVTRDNWRERLDAYFLVGTMESLQLTADLMAAKTGQSRLEVPHLNRSPRSEYELSEECVQKFIADNALDYEIYRYSQERLLREAVAHQLV
ncbi:MAG: hypothetical protein ACREKL_04405 [Chthoniobacterales bacterium]